MAAHAVTSDQYRDIDRRMTEIKRQLNQRVGSPLDPDKVLEALQAIIDVPKWVDVTKAQEIMAGNFHSPVDMTHYFGSALQPDQRVLSAQRVPFSEQVLRDCAFTHILVYCLELSLLDMVATYPDMFHGSVSYLTGSTERFMRTKAEAAGWYLIAIDQASISTGQCWANQLAQVRLSRVQYVPSAAVIAQVLLLHHLTDHANLFRGQGVRTASVDSDGHRVSVGFFGTSGLLQIDRNPDSYADSSIGIAVARKTS